MDAVLHYQIASIPRRHRQGAARGALSQLTKANNKKAPVRCFFPVAILHIASDRRRDQNQIPARLRQRIPQGTCDKPKFGRRGAVHIVFD